MKKIVLVLTMALGLGLIGTTGYADPGPYNATMSVDGYDVTPDSVATPNQTDDVENPQVYEAINHVLFYAGAANPLSPTNNAGTDGYQFVGNNSYWRDLSSDNSSNFALISITAGNTNTLGVYKFGNPGGAVLLPSTTNTGKKFVGTGVSGDAYKGAVNPFPNENFGFALSSFDSARNTTTMFYSDPTLNIDQTDHMLAFYLPTLNGKVIYIDDGSGEQAISLTEDTYLLAWEDLPLSDVTFDSDYNDTIFLVTRVTPIPEPMTMLLFGSGLAGLVGLRKKRS